MSDEINIDQLVEGFLDFDEMIEKVASESAKITMEQQVTDKRLYMYNVSEKNMREEIRKLQELIDNYQVMLTNYNKLQEEKASMKENIEQLSQQKNQLEKDLAMAREKFVQQIHDLQRKHLEEVEKVQCHATELANSEVALYEAKLKDLSSELESKKAAINQKIQEKDAEIYKLKLEYDTKIQKMQQRQIAQASASSGNMAARNDIFRKKLQHLQIESEKETKTLKVKLNEQQQKIDELQHQLKLQHKQFQDQSKQRQDQERTQEKVIRQYQADIRHLQTQLKQEKETVLDLQKTMHKQQIENEKSTSKRKKSMFKPNSNFLGTPLI